MKERPTVFLLLCQIAIDAEYKPGRNPKTGLEFGQTFVGNHKAAGISRQEYRTAMKYLEEEKLASFKPVRGTKTQKYKGTIATLLTDEVFEISNRGTVPWNTDRQKKVPKSTINSTSKPTSKPTTRRSTGVQANINIPGQIDDSSNHHTNHITNQNPEICPTNTKNVPFVPQGTREEHSCERRNESASPSSPALEAQGRASDSQGKENGKPHAYANFELSEEDVW